MTIYKTVAELIEALQQLDQDAILFSTDMPFTGVQLVPQDDGKVLIASPPREAKDDLSTVATGR